MKISARNAVVAVVFIMSGMVIHGAQEAPLGMPIEQQWKGFNAKQEKPKRLVVRDQQAWEKTWAAMQGNRMPEPAVPAIDFDKHMVVAVFMGRKTTGGYSTKIASVEEKDKLIVTVKESSPPKDAMVTMALTSPYHVVVIPKSTREVKFVDQKQAGRKTGAEK